VDAEVPVTRVVIGRASSTQEVGAVAHLAVDPLPNRGRPPLIVPDRPTVVRTVCGGIVIGRVYDRVEATCAFCLAASGQHPGGNGKRFLTRWHRSLHPHVPRHAKEGADQP
jgi:hypothetical protein